MINVLLPLYRRCHVNELNLVATILKPEHNSQHIAENIPKCIDLDQLIHVRFCI